MCRGCHRTLGVQAGCPSSACEGPSRCGGAGQGEGAGWGVRPLLSQPLGENSERSGEFQIRTPPARSLWMGVASSR